MAVWIRSSSSTVSTRTATGRSCRFRRRFAPHLGRFALVAAVSAVPDDGEMPPVEGEAVVGLQLADEGAQLGQGDLLDAVARLAVEVLVALVGQVVDGPAVPEVDVVDDLELLERLEGPVHGRQIHGREPRLDGGGDLLGGDVTSRPDHGLDDGLAAGRAD